MKYTKEDKKKVLDLMDDGNMRLTSEIAEELDLHPRQVIEIIRDCSEFFEDYNKIMARKKVKKNV